MTTVKTLQQGISVLCTIVPTLSPTQTQFFPSRYAHAGFFLSRCARSPRCALLWEPVLPPFSRNYNSQQPLRCTAHSMSCSLTRGLLGVVGSCHSGAFEAARGRQGCGERGVLRRFFSRRLLSLLYSRELRPERGFYMVIFPLEFDL